MAYARKTPKRSARPDEIIFLRSLVENPRIVEEGPLGRCLKRGWCVWLGSDPAPAKRPKGPLPVTITQAGIAAAGLTAVP